jgi:hypothetical protein
MHACVCVCVCVYAHTHTNTGLVTRSHSHPLTLTHVWGRCIHTHTHARTHARTHTHIHTQCVCVYYTWTRVSTSTSKRASTHTTLTNPTHPPPPHNTIHTVLIPPTVGAEEDPIGARGHTLFRCNVVRRQGHRRRGVLGVCGALEIDSRGGVWGGGHGAGKGQRWLRLQWHDLRPAGGGGRGGGGGARSVGNHQRALYVPQKTLYRCISVKRLSRAPLSLSLSLSLSVYIYLSNIYTHPPTHPQLFFLRTYIYIYVYICIYIYIDF